MFFLGLDTSPNACRSVALDITHRIVDISLQNKGDQVPRRREAYPTVHNSLIDCHADVWTRFPVLSEYQRHVKSPSGRLRRSILFVSSYYTAMFQPHFASLVNDFKHTRKPAGTELTSILVAGTTYGGFIKQAPQGISTLNAGGWVVDLLCQIPARIAMAQHNRFVPLKDGNWSPQVERDLLGGTINQVIDNLTLGWYESILKSYYASRVGNMCFPFPFC